MTNTLRGSLFCFTDAIPRHLVPGRVLAAITAVDRRWILSQDNDTAGRQVPDENVVHHLSLNYVFDTSHALGPFPSLSQFVPPTFRYQRP